MKKILEEKQISQKKIDSLKIERSLMSDAYFQLKKISKKLEDSEKRFRWLAENSPDLIYRMSLPDGKYTYVSPASFTILGHFPEEYYKNPNLFKRAIHPDSRQYFQEQWANLIKGKMPPTYEYQIIHKSKEVRWLNQRNIMIRDGKGRPIAIEGVVTDITARKTLETELQTIFDNSSDGILLVEVGSKRLFLANRTFCLMLGCKPKEIEKLSLFDIHPRENSSFILKQFNDLIRKKIAVARNIPVKKKNGSIFYADISGSIIELNSKKYALGMFRDNTEHRRLEEAIKESEEKYSTFVEQASDGVLVIQDGLIKFGNNAIQDMTGYDIKKVINHSIMEFIVDKYKKMMAERYIRHIKGLPTVNRYEFELIKKNGQTLFVETNSTRINFDGRTAVMSVIRDISRAKQIDKMKSEFISVASHQLRGPLTGIKWFSQMLIDKKAGELSAKQANFIQQIHDSNERMIGLVNELLNVSRIESGQSFIVDKKTGNIASLIASVVNDCKASSSSKGISVRLDNSFSCKLVLSFDHDKIYQVFSNLINNSIKYSNVGKRIVIGFKRLDGEVKFFVRDYGCGIPEDQKDRIFQRFFRANNVATISPEGTGLGLYIAKGIVEAHGGKMWFKSEQDKGTTFYFTLPLKTK